MSYIEIADRIGVHANTVRRWLNPSLRVKQRWWLAQNRAKNPGRQKLYDERKRKSMCERCGRSHRGKPGPRSYRMCLACYRILVDKRRERILALREEGLLNSQIAAHEGIPVSTVGHDVKILVRAGRTQPRPKGRPGMSPQLKAAIAAARRYDGFTYRELAHRFGVSNGSVSNVLSEHGLTKDRLSADADCNNLGDGS